MSTSDIIEELANYSRSTSVRGVPKFVNSKDKVLKGLWMACVLICASVLIFLLINSFQKYYTWPVMTQSGELIGGNITFPDVTICNIDPFGAAYPETLPVDTYLNFIDTYRPKFKNIFMNKYKFDAQEEQIYYNDLYSIPAYISNLPKYDELENADCPSFIVDCDIFMLNWMNSEMKCTQRTKHFKFWDQNYYTCYTISTSKINSFPNITVRGLSLVLNVGPTNFNQLPFRESLIGSQTRGVQISIHSPDKQPDLKRGFSLAPGTENVVTVVQRDRHRLDKPHNKLGCTNDEFMSTFPLEKYSLDLCVDFCKQKLIYENCGCMSHYLSIPVSFHDQMDVCLNFSLSDERHYINDSYNETQFRKIVERYECTSQYLCFSSCEIACMIPCHETNYDTYLTSSPWPHPALQMDLFENYILNCTQTNKKVDKRYSKYLQIPDIYESLKLNETQSRQRIASISELTQIQESLLVVKIIIKDNYPFHSVDQIAYTWDTMLGVIGGTLSLWLGITVATGVELIELVYLIVKRHLKMMKVGNVDSAVDGSAGKKADENDSCKIDMEP